MGVVIKTGTGLDVLLESVLRFFAKGFVTGN